MAKLPKIIGKTPSKLNHNKLIEDEPYPAHLQGAILVCAVTVICLLPFIGKAFNIDEPLFVWAAKHIAAGNFFNPYSFHVNWYGSDMPMFDVTKNPPLACYYIALAGTMFGWSEIALHTAMILPAIAAILGTYLLASRLCSRPVQAALATLLTPVFLVSSTAVMSDTMMLALFVWAVFIWIVGLEKDKHSYLAVSALLIAACALTKYYGIVLIGLLMFYSLMKERRFGWWMAHFLITILILAAYQLITKEIYGRGLILDAASYATEIGQEGSGRLLVGLSFTGGCLASIAFYALHIFPKKRLSLVLVSAVVLALALPYISTVTGIKLILNDTVRWNISAQLGLMSVLGAGILALAVTDFIKRKNAESAMLALWVIGTYIFAAYINWTVNGRTILPMVPAVGILMMRSIDQSKTANFTPFVLRFAVPPIAAIFSLLITWSDFSLANIQRVAATQIKESHSGVKQTIWYEGHWGFQYYMDELGFKAVDYKASDLIIGDIIVMPQNNTGVIELPDSAAERFDVIELGKGRIMTTMSGDAGAGFYAHGFGPLPYAFGSIPVEQYKIFRITTAKIYLRLK